MDRTGTDRTEHDPTEHDRTEQTGAAAIDDTILAKVRALLAKAESTTFEAEAEALTAKAQELMARYRIEEALLDRGGVATAIVHRVLGLQAPYAREKAVLLTEVGRANSVRVVWDQRASRATLVGHPLDTAVTEELFTSLLVQATSALGREGSRYDLRGSNRTTTFRRSFLLAYAGRIGERLRATTEQTVAEAADAALPVLAARQEQVDAATRAAFPRLGSFTATARDAEGWRLGTAVAQRADLGVAPRVRA